MTRIPKLWKPHFEHKLYAKGISIEETLFEDNLYSGTGLPATVTDQPAILGENAEIQRENAAVEVFNYGKVASGLSPAGFNLAGADGSALFATDHELYPGAASGSDQSNLAALALDATNLGTLHALGRKWLDNAGNPLGVRLTEVMTPVELADAAEVCLVSALRPGTANNDSNTSKISNMIVWDFLTDTNLWFYMDPKLRKRLLVWYERRKLRFMADSPLTTLTARWRADMRYSRGPVHWAFVMASEVS